MPHLFDRIGPRLAAVLSLLLLLLVANSVLVLTRMGVIDTRFETVYNDRIVPMQQLQSVADGYFLGMVDTAHKVRDGSMTPEDGIKAVTQALPQIEQNWQAYLKTRLTPEEKVLAAEMSSRMKALQGMPDKLIGLLRSQDKAALTEWAAKEMYPTLDPIADSVTKLMDLQRQVAKEEYEFAATSHKSAQWILLVTTTLAVLLGSLLGWHVVSTLLKQLGGEPSYATQVAREIAKGNLAVDVAVRHGDDHSLLAGMRDMRDSLSRVVGHVRSGSSRVAQDSVVIADGNADLKQRTETQAARLRETAASMES